jgi:hypothetical protein
MNTWLVLASFLSLAACSSVGAPAAGAKSSTAHSSEISADPFPVATAGITIHVEENKQPMIDDLLGQIEKVTGVHFLVTQETRSILRKAPTGLLRDLEIPREQVWTAVETILIQNEFTFVFASQDEPKLISVWSMQGNVQRQAMRNFARFVPREELRAWSKHPSVLVTTLLTLDSTDVRTLSNSMRTMFTDTNTQQIIPVGNANSLILTGFANSVAAIADMLERVNEAERKRLAEEAKRPPPPGRESAEAPKPAAK